MTAKMKRRNFITLLGGAAAWPLAARAQQPERMRRIGALLYPAADDPTAEASIAAFRQGLQRLGWSEGRNISILTRAAVVRDPSITSGIGQFGAIQAVAPSLRVELTPIDVRDGEIEQAIAAFARGSNGGLIVTASPTAVRRRELIVALATKHRLPSVLPGSAFAASGGLISYGADDIEQHRQAAGYVDRILRGEKAADLPVQAPVKYALVINLKTARTLGLEVPPTLLARADEVVE